MQTDEISRIPIRILIEGLGEAEGEFVRFLAPRTVDALLRVLPLQGRVAILKEQVYFQVQLKIGPEKATPKALEGDIAYWPMGNALCVFTGSMKTHGPVNRIGKNLSNLEIFRKVQFGTRIRVERKSDCT